MADWRVLGQVRGGVSEYGGVGRRAGEHSDCDDEYVGASWHYLCAIGVGLLFPLFSSRGFLVVDSGRELRVLCLDAS